MIPYTGGWRGLMKIRTFGSRPPELLEEVVDMDSAIAEAYRKFEEAIQDEEADRAYWAHRKFEHDLVSRLNHARREGYAEGVEQGIEQGIAQGIVKGIENSMIEIAQKLKARGRPLEEIAEITGLSLEVIGDLD